MYKSIIAPIVAVIFLAIQGIFGIEVDAVVQSQVVDVLVNVCAIVAVLVGIFQNHKK